LVFSSHCSSLKLGHLSGVTLHAAMAAAFQVHSAVMHYDIQVHSAVMHYDNQSVLFVNLANSATFSTITRDIVA
jgi:hypothetical protein